MNNKSMQLDVITKIIIAMGIALCSLGAFANRDKERANAKGGPSEKVTICHFDSDTGEVQTISISGNALQSHLDNHGDFIGECDSDADGVLQHEDNCTDVANPDQGDEDGDGVGDLCDNCAIIANPDQGSVEEPEICDGLDNNCDGQIDEDIAPVPREAGTGDCVGEVELVCSDGDFVTEDPNGIFDCCQNSAVTCIETCTAENCPDATDLSTCDLSVLETCAGACLAEVEECSAAFVSG